MGDEFLARCWTPRIRASIIEQALQGENGMRETITRSLFSGLRVRALNDAGVPPFAAHEADEDEGAPLAGGEFDIEMPASQWHPIPPAAPPSDVPVRFIDGSIATRTVASIEVNGRIRPVLAAVISAAGLEMDGRTLRRSAGARTRRVVCMYGDGIEPTILDEARDGLRELGTHLLVRISDAALPDFDTLRRMTRGLAMEAMEQDERAVLLHSAGTPTLVDGLLERRLAGALDQNVAAVGLVKRQMALYLPPSLQELLHRLRPGERSPAFLLRTEHVDLVNTYMRLSSQPGASPTYGIVRVTVPSEYVRRRHAGEMSAYLSGLAGHLYRLRHRDLAYARAGISIEPIVRCEDHLHAIRPDIEAFVTKLHRMFATTSDVEGA